MLKQKLIRRLHQCLSLNLFKYRQYLNSCQLILLGQLETPLNLTALVGIYIIGVNRQL